MYNDPLSLSELIHHFVLHVNTKKPQEVHTFVKKKAILNESDYNGTEIESSSEQERLVYNLNSEKE